MLQIGQKIRFEYRSGRGRAIDSDEKEVVVPVGTVLEFSIIMVKMHDSATGAGAWDSVPEEADLTRLEVVERDGDLGVIVPSFVAKRTMCVEQTDGSVREEISHYPCPESFVRFSRMGYTVAEVVALPA